LLGLEAPYAVTVLSDVPTVSAPMPWQAGEWLRLNQQIVAGQFPHALLVSGPEYTGKSRLALALARLLLCAEPAEGLNCGHCHACELSASGNHGDFCWLEPEGKSRVIKVDQIRKVVEFTNRTAGFGLRKLVVFSPAEDMNISAANALLKVLEEPPANTHLILVCHRLHGLPATVRSRCQILRPALPTRDESLDWLDLVCGTRSESERLLDLADARPLLAAQLHGQAGAEGLQLVRQAMSALFAGRADVTALAMTLGEGDLGQALEQLIAGIQTLLRGLDSERLATSQARAGFQLLDEILQIQRATLNGSNPNPQLLLDALLAKVQRELGDGGLGDNIGKTQRGALL
jgi:DNA polymerase-3 subunit delta'